jgi:NADH:ubiquinone oxidoreductase subunit C
MTQEELFAKISTKFPKIAKAAVPVKDYLTVRLETGAELLPFATWLKANGFDYLEMATGVDYLSPVDMRGFIRQPNFNPFLPEGATPQIESAPTTGYAYRPMIDLVWSFLSVTGKARVFVRLELPRENPSAPSLTGLFKAADWQEREAFDLLGVNYVGHPNMTKILTPDFIKGHPLRKDYVHVKDRFDE